MASSDDAGIAKISIDEQQVALLDQYGRTRNVRNHTDFDNLVDGRHTMTVMVPGNKSQASKAAILSIARFEVLDHGNSRAKDFEAY